MKNAIACTNQPFNFILNLDTLNYTYSSGYGWAFGVNDTINISHGTCAKF